MRTAETLLNIIQDRGKRKLPLDDVYRQLYNPDFSLRSYAKMYKNDGAMTPGTTEETVDGMSLKTVHDRVRALLTRETRPCLTSFPIIIRASLRPAAKTRQSLGATEPVLQHGSRSRMTPALVAPALGRR